MSLSCRILFLTGATLFTTFVPLSGRIVPTTTTASNTGQPKTLLWLSLLPLATRIQSDEIATAPNRNTSATLSDNYSLNNADSDDENTRPRPDLYPVLLPVYPPPYAAPYVAPYAPVPLRQPYLSDATDEDTLLRTEFIKGVLEGLQGAGAAATSTYAADMKIASDEVDSNKLLRSNAREISERKNGSNVQKRRKLPFVLLDDAKLPGGAASQSGADTERIYNIYEVHVV